MALMIILSCVPTFASGAELSETIIVTTGAELDAAIKTVTGTESATIVLANDIDAIASATYASYSTGSSLTIDGQGHKIDGHNVQDTGLRFGGRGQDANIVIRNTVFANMLNDDRNGGGAVAVWRGTVDVSGSTFIGNANNNATRGTGGGVMLQAGNGTLTISNSTFTGNSAYGNGGAIYSGPAGTLNNVTVVANSSATAPGGVFGPLTVTNSIIGENTTGSETADANVGATTVVADGYNVIGTATAGWLATELDATGTLALLNVVGSPAIDKANPVTATPVDQRGVVRDATPDIGAYEFVPEPDSLILNSDANLIMTDEYFRVNAGFNNEINSNVVVLEIKFDAAMFDYRGFTPASGVQVLETRTVDGGMRFTFMIGDYKAKDFGEILFSAKEVEKGYHQIDGGAAYVTFDEAGEKVICELGGGVTITTNDGGAYDLIFLSNMIDWFGIDSGHVDWSTTYRFYDFNNSGSIDIPDIAHVAQLIK